MTEEEARKIIVDAYKEVDWLNFPRMLQTLGEFGLGWKKFDNTYFRPDYDKGWKDMQYMLKYIQKLNEAIKFMKENK